MTGRIRIPWLHDWHGQEKQATRVSLAVAVISGAVLAMIMRTDSTTNGLPTLVVGASAALIANVVSCVASHRLARDDAKPCGSRVALNTERLASLTSLPLAIGIVLGGAMAIGQTARPWWPLALIYGPVAVPVLTLLLIPLMSIGPYTGGRLGSIPQARRSRSTT